MKKILLIEDDIVLRENTAELLAFSDFEVITAANGKIGAALAIVDLPDIIVCDIMMPELDGYGVLETLSKDDATKYIPFIFLSAKTEKKDVRKGMDLGADDYIAKPFSEEELVSAIKSRLAKTAILFDERNSQKNGVTKNNGEITTLNDLKNFFDDNGEVFKYSEKDIVYNEGYSSNLIYLVLKGVVKAYKLDEQGKELTTAIFKEDDLFGYTSFTHNLPYQETAKAIQDIELVGIPKSELKNIIDNNHRVALELLELLNDNITGIKKQLVQMAYSSASKKTAVTLLKFANKLNTRPEDSIKISRTDLASVAGIAKETLIRTISSFKKQGIIEVEDRSIRILDIQKLQNMY